MQIGFVGCSAAQPWPSRPAFRLLAPGDDPGDRRGSLPAPVVRPLQPRSYTLTPIAETSDRFADFATYVASLNDRGVVAFQATLTSGGSGVYTGSGGPIATVIESHAGPLSDVSSHPDINRAGSTCFYAGSGSGGSGVILVRDGQVIPLAGSAGPLGPTMNEAGTVAFRADLATGGSGIFSADGGSIRTVAEANGGDLGGFQGLPVINRRGSVVFRADLTVGGQGVYLGDGGPLTTLAETGDVFSDLGRFPIVNDAGAVAVCATLRGGGSGVFVLIDEQVETVIDASSPFESFRGVLLDGAGTIVFYATPTGGALGVFSGPDPVTDRLISIGGPLFGSTIVDFALNPVSINDIGQIAIRVRLADDRQFIVRADPTG